ETMDVKFQVIRDQRRHAGGGYFAALGPFESREEAEAVRAALESAGLDLEQKRRERYASEALLDIVRTLYGETHSFNAVARKLEEARIPTARGKIRWTPTTVKRLLEQEPQARPPSNLPSVTWQRKPGQPGQPSPRTK